jgi:hypothetical protein
MWNKNGIKIPSVYTAIFTTPGAAHGGRARVSPDGELNTIAKIFYELILMDINVIEFLINNDL